MNVLSDPFQNAFQFFSLLLLLFMHLLHLLAGLEYRLLFQSIVIDINGAIQPLHVVVIVLQDIHTGLFQADELHVQHLHF